MEGGLGQTIVIIGVLVAVLLSAYYVTKFLAKKGKRLTQSKHIKVIDQIYLSTDKQIALIKVGGKNLLVGITPQNINLISQVDEEIIDETQKAGNEAHANPTDFVSKTRDFIKKAWGSQQELKDARSKSKQKIKDNKATKIPQDDFAAVLESVNIENKENDSNKKDGKAQ